MENLGKESQKEKDEENKQKCTQTDRQTDRQIDRQTDRERYAICKNGKWNHQMLNAKNSPARGIHN